MIEFHRHVVSLLSNVRYKPGFAFRVGGDKHRVFVQVSATVTDAIDGQPREYRGGKAWLSEHMVDGEIIQLAFGLCQSYEIHECREFFTYKGKRIFGPHIDPEALLDVCDRTVGRASQPATLSN